MKRLRKKLENIFTAAAFAEAGEFDTAREIMREPDSRNERISKRSDRGYTPRPVVHNARSK